MAAPSVAESIPSTLKLARVAFTGKLASMTRREAAAIVRQAGGTPTNGVTRGTSILVVGMDGWPLLADGTVSRKLRQAETLQHRGRRVRIISEAVFLELAGLAERRPALRKSHPAAHVCELLGLDEATLRRWEQFGLIRARDGCYDFQDLVSLRTVAELVGRGVDPQTIGRSMRGLASVLPGTERPLSQLKIVVEHPGTLLAELGNRLVAPDGQLLLNFSPAPAPEGEALPARIGKEDAAPDADACLERGHALEEQERWTEAAEVYRAALTLRPDFAEASFNLGNVLRSLGDNDGAEERFRTAIAGDPTAAEAWYNLADLQEGAGRLEEAIDSLRRAVEVSPGYADAHFNLAYAYERVGRREEARGHWSAYLQYDAESEWADTAREHLSR